MAEIALPSTPNRWCAMDPPAGTTPAKLERRRWRAIVVMLVTIWLVVAWLACIALIVARWNPVALQFSRPGQRIGEQAVACSPDGGRLVGARRKDGQAYVWNTRSSAKVLTLADAAGPIESASWSPDGKRIVTISRLPRTEIRNIRLWNADSGAEVAFVSAAEAGRSLAPDLAWFSPDGRFLLAVGQVWDAADGKRLASLEVPVELEHPTASFARDGSRVLVAGAMTGRPGGGQAVVCDLPAGRKVWSKFHVESAALVADGQRVVLTDRDGTRIEAIGSPAATVVLPDSREVVFSADGRWIAAFEHGVTGQFLPAYQPPHLRICDASTGAVRGDIPFEHVTEMAFSPDSALLATVNNDGDAKIWRVPSGRHLATLPPSKTAIGPDGLAVPMSQPQFADNDHLLVGHPLGLWRVDRPALWLGLRPEWWGAVLLPLFGVAILLVWLIRGMLRKR
jgi:WD40 repeat protein